MTSWIYMAIIEFDPGMKAGLPSLEDEAIKNQISRRQKEHGGHNEEPIAPLCQTVTEYAATTDRKDESRYRQTDTKERIWCVHYLPVFSIISPPS